MSDDGDRSPARKDPFAVIVPTEADLTAPVHAATEMSKMFIFAANKVAELSEQTWQERVIIPGENGQEDVERVIIHDNAKLPWWFDQCRKILTDVAKINANVEAKVGERRVRTLEIFLNSDAVPKDVRDKLAVLAMKQRLDEEK